MQREIEWTWPRRTLSVVIAAAMVLALLLVVERPSNAGAQTQSAVASTAIAQQASRPSVIPAVAARSGAASVVPAQILPFLPPSVLARICAGLLRALASVSRLGPFGAFAAAVIAEILAVFGCGAISGI